MASHCTAHWQLMIGWNPVAGVLYLCMKSIERSHTPNALWERIKLPKDYGEALKVIDTQMVSPSLSIIFQDFLFTLKTLYLYECEIMCVGAWAADSLAQVFGPQKQAATHQNDAVSDSYEKAPGPSPVRVYYTFTPSPLTPTGHTHADKGLGDGGVDWRGMGLQTESGDCACQAATAGVPEGGKS